MNRYWIILLLVPLVFLTGCPGDNVAGNRPIRTNPSSFTSVPTSHKGKDAVFVSDHASIFYLSTADPVVTKATFVEWASDGDKKADEAIHGPYSRGKHSLQQVINDDLVMITCAAFFDKVGSLTFSEGTYLIYFSDGSTTRDQGGVADMYGKDPTTYRHVRRSYANDPLTVSNKQRPGKLGVPISFLVPRENLNKKVVRIEQIP